MKSEALKNLHDHGKTGRDDEDDDSQDEDHHSEVYPFSGSSGNAG